MVVGEVIPGIAAFTVVFTHGAPLTLAQVGSPFLPRDSCLARIIQAFLLSDIDNMSGHFSPLLFLALRDDLDFLTCLAFVWIVKRKSFCRALPFYKRFGTR